MDFDDLQQNMKLAREKALLGEYDAASVFYQYAINKIARFLPNIAADEPARRHNFNTVRM